MKATPSPQAPSPQEIFDIELPLMRAKVLELAASLDRIDRAEGVALEGQQLAPLQQAIETLLRPDNNRAEQIQQIFSRPYQENWRTEMNL